MFKWLEAVMSRKRRTSKRYTIYFRSVRLVELSDNTHIDKGIRNTDQIRHRCQQIVHQLVGQDRDEDVLPTHGVDDGVGRLNTGRESVQPAWGEDDASLVQHWRKHNHHVVAIHRVVVLCEIALQQSAQSYFSFINTNLILFQFDWTDQKWLIVFSRKNEIV